MLIVTHFRTSVTALETDAHQVPATLLIARPGTWPTITIPMTGGHRPDVEGACSYLRDAADFFGIPMVQPQDLTSKLDGITATYPYPLVAVTIIVLEADGVPSLAVSGTPVQPWSSVAVRIAGDESIAHPHRAADPWWRRMAARTTSMGELDQLERWLTGRGYVDGVTDGQPLLGALILDTPNGLVGVENPEPTSVLEQLERCSITAPIERLPALPADATRAWWVSPRYETHPVAELAGVTFAVDDEAVPPWVRWS